MVNAIKMHGSPQDAVGSVRMFKKPFTEYASSLVSKLYEKGYYAVNERYIVRPNEIILNRSKGADSNFSVVIRADKDSVVSYFMNPADDANSLELKKEDILISYKFNGQNAEVATDFFTRAMAASESKKSDVYYFLSHCHVGFVDGKQTWDDGIMSDHVLMRRAMLGNFDIVAVTSHNWTQDEKTQKFLKEKLEAANIVSIPAWENTTTVNFDVFKSPHILCYCSDIEAAMKIKEEFLVKKLLPNGSEVTPILRGVPVSFDEQMRTLTGYRDKGMLALVVAHPFSTLPGIDLFDPKIIRELGYNRCWEILKLADGVERYNGAEPHSNLNFDMSDGKLDFKSAVADDLRKKLSDNSLAKCLSPPMLNYYAGLWKIKEEGGFTKGFTTYGHDSHFLEDIDENHLSPLEQGHTRLIITPEMFSKLKKDERKISSEELVSFMRNKQFDLGEQSRMEAFAYAKIGDKGPEVVESRNPSFLEKVMGVVHSKPEYYWRIAALEWKYWFGNEKQKKEIAKELTKAKSFRLKP